MKDLRSYTVDEAGVIAVVQDFVEHIKFMDNKVVAARLSCLIRCLPVDDRHVLTAVIGQFNSLATYKTSADLS